MAQETVETFGAVIKEVLRRRSWKHADLARRLGVSTKTVGRYLNEGMVPPPSRRHGVVYALRELESPLLLRVATSLAVAADFGVDLPHAARDPELSRQALEAAVIEVAERLDSGPGRVRRALALFLTLVTAADLDARSAAALVSGQGRGEGERSSAATSRST